MEFCDLCGEQHGECYDCQSPQAERSREIRAELRKDPRDREIERLQAIVDDLLSGIEEVGVGLFGPDDGRSWRDAKASWWQSLLKAVAAALAAKEKA